jgi:SOS-response transcriptional repressor LexA
MKSPYTSGQGQVLAFIHHYTTLHGRPPAEAEMAHFFQVTPPSAHLMVLALERRGLITRTPGEARSIKLRVKSCPFCTAPSQARVLGHLRPGPNARRPSVQPCYVWAKSSLTTYLLFKIGITSTTRNSFLWWTR